MAIARKDAANNAESLRAVEWRLVSSNFVNQLGSKAWEFALPLLLVHLTGGQLSAPAVLGIATTGAEFLLGPAAGRFIDRSPSRLAVVATGAAAQTAAVAGTLCCLLAAWAVGWVEGEAGGGRWGAAGSSGGLVWFGAAERHALGVALLAALCACGVVEALGRMVSKVSVERDWVPTAIAPFGEAALARVNARMANADLIGEIAGPLFAGAVLQAAPSAAGGFALIALVNAASFMPHLWLLVAVCARCPALRARAEAAVEASPKGASSDAASLGAWRIFLAHPSGVAVLSLSYALLWFTLLSSHDAVLTAYLAEVGLDPATIATFRALGALSGVCGALTFEWAAARGGAKQMAGLYLLGQAVAISFAAVALTFYPGRAGGGLLPFLAAIVVSRAGLYGFDVGFTTLSQGLVEERHRGAVGAATSSLCALVQLCMYVATSGITGLAGSDGVPLLVWASAGAVAAAACTYAYWSAHHQAGEVMALPVDGRGGARGKDPDTQALRAESPAEPGREEAV